MLQRPINILTKQKQAVYLNNNHITRPPIQDRQQIITESGIPVKMAVNNLLVARQYSHESDPHTALQVLTLACTVRRRLHCLIIETTFRRTPY
jgi:hypothetical protein